MARVDVAFPEWAISDTDNRTVAALNRTFRQACQNSVCGMFKECNPTGKSKHDGLIEHFVLEVEEGCYNSPGCRFQEP